MAGEVLIIHNVTRYCDDEYECVAFNDVPPIASRKIRVHVQCESAFWSRVYYNADVLRKLFSGWVREREGVGEREIERERGRQADRERD